MMADAEKRRRFTAGACIAGFFLLLLLLFWLAGGPLTKFLSQPEAVRAWVDRGGVWSRLAFVGMMVLQIVVAFIPGEPLEICAGYAFGAVQGTLLCLAGAIIGGVLVFLFVRSVGIRAVEVFFPREKIESLSFLRNSRKLNLLVFLLVFIPGTPKDILGYMVGLTPMTLPTWLLITGTARIPSIVTSTIGGSALGMGDTQFAAVVFIVTLMISAAGLLVYDRLCKKQREDQ